MNEELYKIGDRVLVKSGYHCFIVDIQKGWFFTKYICKWTVRDSDSNSSYGVAGIKRKWQILCKN